MEIISLGLKVKMPFSSKDAVMGALSGPVKLCVRAQKYK